MSEVPSRTRIIGPQEYGVISYRDLMGVDCLITPKLEVPWLAVGFSLKAPGAPMGFLAVCTEKTFTRNLDLLIGGIAYLRAGSKYPIDMRLVTPYTSQLSTDNPNIPGLLEEFIEKFRWIHGQPQRPTHGILRLVRSLSTYGFRENERIDIRRAIEKSHLNPGSSGLVLRPAYTHLTGETVYNGGNGKQAS